MEILLVLRCVRAGRRVVGSAALRDIASSAPTHGKYRAAIVAGNSDVETRHRC